MQDIVKHNATYADLEAVPPNLVAEILHGKLVTHPQPTGLHSEIHYSLGFVLGEYRQGLGQRGGWRFLTEPELHVGDDVVVPELAGWRIAHIPPPPQPDPLTVAKREPVI